MKTKLLSIKMAADCGKCTKSLKNVKQRVECSDCKALFHCKCVNMSVDDVTYLNEQGQFWRCEVCSVERRKSLRVETMENVNYEDIYKMFLDLKSKFVEVEKNLGQSLNSCHDQLIETTASIKSQNEEIVSLRASLDKALSENAMLRNTVSKLETRVEELEQYSRRNAFEVYGIPKTENENVINIVMKVGEALGVPIEETQIDACHRLKAPESGKPPGIIVKMVRRVDTELMLKKKREKKDFSTRHIGMAVDSPIYVNESLTPGNRRLLGATRAARKAKNYRYLWVRNGKILLRKDDGHEVVVVKSLNDLDRL